MNDKHHVLPASELIALVNDARERTLHLVSDLHPEQLSVVLEETVNPFLWELGHVAFFYDVFLLGVLDQGEPLLGGAPGLYDSFRVDHDDRWSLPLPDLDTTLDYMRRVQEAVVRRLDVREPDARETYHYLLSVLHEDMHGEAFTYMRQTLEFASPQLGEQAKPAGPLPGDVEIPGRTFWLGASEEEPFVFDNEKWAHPVEVPSFRIARAPVTNAEFRDFVEDAGYLRPELWGMEGRVWRNRTGALHPVYWARGESGWLRRSFDTMRPLEPHAPVDHVTWYEAEAWCNWAGRRLPSEAEWELAACGDPGGLPESKRRYPWGDEPPTAERANLDARFCGPVDVGALPGGDSAFGCRQMLGNVWEWTASPFYPFPGYVIDQPYKEYSAPWFGYRKVLKGGAWATRSRLARPGYRNFFQPYRSDIFAGFRSCAR